MQAVAVAVAVVAVSVVACISCCQVSLWFKAHNLHEISIFRVMFLNNQRKPQELLQGRTVKMTIHQMIKEISINHDYEISQINIVLKGSVVLMKRYEKFIVY